MELYKNRPQVDMALSCELQTPAVGGKRAGKALSGLSMGGGIPNQVYFSVSSKGLTPDNSSLHDLLFSSFPPLTCIWDPSCWEHPDLSGPRCRASLNQDHPTKCWWVYS